MGKKYIPEDYPEDPEDLMKKEVDLRRNKYIRWSYDFFHIANNHLRALLDAIMDEDKDMVKSLETKLKHDFDLFRTTFEIVFGLETMTFAEQDLDVVRNALNVLEESFNNVFDACKKNEWLLAEKLLEETGFAFDDTNRLLEPLVNWTPSKEQLRGEGYEEWKKHFKR